MFKNTGMDMDKCLIMTLKFGHSFELMACSVCNKNYKSHLSGEI